MKDEEVKVSVIVLTFNHEKYIAQALDSILMQETDFNYEILVGDDASSDNTAEIVRQYAEEFPAQVRPYFRTHNVGASYNAYCLIQEARGDYLAFCEGDDFWLSKDKLSTQICFLESDASFIGCSHPCRIVDENGVATKRQRISWVRKKNRFSLSDFKGLYLPGQTATIVKRNIFKDSTEDYSFLYQINRNTSDRTSTLLYLSKGDFGFIPQVMSAYRRSTNSVPTSLTDTLYTFNHNSLPLELEYTERLEKVATMNWNLGNLFGPYYAQLYATAVYHFFRDLSSDSYMLLARAASHIGRGLIHPVAFAYGIYQKVRNRI